MPMAKVVVRASHGSRGAARERRRARTCDEFGGKGALDMYKLNNYRYPTTEQGLEALIEKPNTDPVPKNYQAGGYLKGGKLPTDAWDNQFLYFFDKGKYEIISLGSDGTEGGEGDAADISSLDI